MDITSALIISESFEAGVVLPQGPSFCHLIQLFSNIQTEPEPRGDDTDQLPLSKNKNSSVHTGSADSLRILLKLVYNHITGMIILCGSKSCLTYDADRSSYYFCYRPAFSQGSSGGTWQAEKDLSWMRCCLLAYSCSQQYLMTEWYRLRLASNLIVLRSLLSKWEAKWRGTSRTLALIFMPNIIRIIII